MESGICNDGKQLLVIFGGKVGIGTGNATFHHEDGLEEKYKTLFLQQCANQHEVGEEIGVPFPLTMYCARHTWATLSQQIGAPIEVISKGLGHDNVQTTTIYLASIETSIVDKYNKNLIDKTLNTDN